MTTSTNHARPNPRRGARAAALLVSAGALAMSGAVGEASAATTAWTPATGGLPNLPSPSVDGEITVTQVQDGQTTGSMKSFTAAGAPVSYATTVNWRDAAWGPAGDVVSGSPEAGGVVTTSDGTGEKLSTRPTVRPAQWSPFGESLTRSTASGQGFSPAAAWVGGSRIEQLGPELSTDPGAAAVLPNGAGMLLETGTSPNRDLALENATFPRIANSTWYDPVTAPVALGYSSLDAHTASVSADGTLAFVGGSGSATALYVDEGNGPQKVADLGADCPGQRPAFSPSATMLSYVKPVGGTCAATELRIISQQTNTFVSGPDALVTTSPSASHFESPSWRAKTPAVSGTRLAGSDRIATGVAISQWGWSANRAVTAVVASSGSYADSIVGGPLAGGLGGPLLLTPSSSLDSRTLTELKRVLDPDGFVYIVGGTGAVSAGVETALRNNGIWTVRLGGSDRFGTSVAVAKAIDTAWDGNAGATPVVTRTTAFLADGMNFPDALVAGPPASTFLAPVLLTNGTSTPGVVQTYVSSRTKISRIYAIGDNAVSAGSSAFGTKSVGIAGPDRYATAQQVAERLFPGASVIGYASGMVFPDALTGGALMGSLAQPLLLTKGSSLPSVIAAQANAFRPATDLVLTFGGSAVVPDSVRLEAAWRAGTETAYFGSDVPVVTNPKVTASSANLLSGTRATLRETGGSRVDQLRNPYLPRPDLTP